jgi:hypothetical protein
VFSLFFLLKILNIYKVKKTKEMPAGRKRQKLRENKEQE